MCLPSDLQQCDRCKDVFCTYHAEAVGRGTLIAGHLCPASKDKPPAPAFVPPERLTFIREGVVASETAGSHLKVVIYNCGLLRLKGLAGGILFENPPFADERFAALPAALLQTDADVIALTEIYEDAHVSELLKQVSERFPHSARGDPRGTVSKHVKFHNGLMFLSKLPIEEHKCIRNMEAAAMEKYLGDKAMLTIKIDAGSLGKMFIVNMHTTAGGGLDPEAVDAIRESELKEAVDLCAEAMSAGYKGIILGDLNMGPEASPANYDFMLAQGYSDEVIKCAASESEKPEGKGKGKAEPAAADLDMPIFTWDPKNPLNVVGPHAKSPPQRCDHLFVHSSAGLVASSCAVIFAEANVETARGPVTMSDHYGLSVNLQAA